MTLQTRCLLLLLCCAPGVWAQDRGWSGTWTASGAGKTLGGTWTARPHNQPNVSSGTWVIVDASGKPILTGSWSARKADKSWVGTWQARVSSSSGGVYSGSWTAESPVASASQFVGLFEYALTNTTRGTWRIGSQSGQWAISASPRAR